MHARVERLHAAGQDLGGLRVVADRDDRDAGVGERALRAAGGEDLDPERGEPLREGDEAGLVGDGDERAADHLHLPGKGVPL